VREVLSNIADLRGRVRDIVLQQFNEDTVAQKPIEEYRKERDAVEQQIDFVIEQLGSLGRDVATKKMEKLKARLSELDGLLASATRPPRPALDVDSHVDLIVKRLTALSTSDELPSATVRQLLRLLVSRLEVDLETRQARLELALPVGMLHSPSEFSFDMCLNSGTASHTQLEAHGENRLFSLILGRFDCPAEGRPMCISCHRLKEAA
jgi:hypothetical protein